MAWSARFKALIPQHKYAIDSQALGDISVLAWSNLGLWQSVEDSYPQACEHLASHLADAMNLNSNDHLLDLGCGQGASLNFWLKQQRCQSLSAVELQLSCVKTIQKTLNSKVDIHQNSFLNLKHIFPEKRFNAVLCIDAAYHSNLNSFLEAAHQVLNSKGRLGFHYLVLSDDFLNSNRFRQIKYQYLLKAADVNLNDLCSKSDLKQLIQHTGFVNIKIEDLSSEVLAGFADYIERYSMNGTGLERLKIEMTAKLCRRLYEDGDVRYVQIVATRDG